MRISREQVVGRIRAAGYRFHKRGDHTEMYRTPNNTRRVFVPRRDLFEEKAVRLVLSQAGLTNAQIEEFIEGAAKS